MYGSTCLSASACYAVGTDGNILATTTGGTSWSAEASGTTNNLYSVSCPVGGTSCYVAGDSGTIVVGSSSSPSPPTISSFSPTSGAPGITVTIDGTNLENATLVSFNGVAATTIKKDTDTKIKVVVPPTATTGKIKVTTPGGTATSSSAFKVT